MVPLSDVLEIALVGPGQTEAIPLVQPGGKVPAAHAGSDAVAVKLSVFGLYSSAVNNACCPGGDPTGGDVAVDRNELPVEPPTINACPSSDVPLPEIRVTLGPLRAMVMRPPLPLPAKLKVLVLSSNSSAVCSASHWKPETML